MQISNDLEESVEIIIQIPVCSERRYLCKRCGLDFNQKITLISHLKKKKTCIPIEKDLDPNELIEELKDNTKKEGLLCDTCNKIYKNVNSLRMHKCLAKTQKNTLENNEILETLAVLKNENKIMKKKLDDLEKNKNCKSSIKNITNNNSTNNGIINNITINAFGKENLEHLYDKALPITINVIKNKLEGLLKMSEKIYMDPAHPENQTIGIHSRKRGMFRYIKANNEVGYCDYKEAVEKTISWLDTYVQEMVDTANEDTVMKHITDTELINYNKLASALGMGSIINKDDDTEDDYEKIEGITIVKTKEQENKKKKKEQMKKDVMTNFSKQLIEKHIEFNEKSKIN
jgi:hypothetical protein